MLSKMSQNIFDYATSELSQDAFISLMVSWFDSSDESLKQISKDFITKIFNEYNTNYLSSQLHNLEIKSVKLRQQHYKIDVFFEVTTDKGDIIPFIIEDKTWTEPHSDQLQKYAKKIKKPSIKIFFKTGHVTEKDIKLTNDNEVNSDGTAKAQYMILDIKWIYDFLSIYKNNITDVIFTSYFDYLKRNFYDKLYIDSGRKKTLIDWTASDLKEGFVQYELIKAIKANIDNPSQNFISFTKNGKRWDTWWTFLKKDDTQFFVKVKQIGKTSHRIRLIEYSTSDNKHQHWEICKKIINSLSDTLIQVTDKPRHRAKETEIAYIEIMDDKLEKYAKSFASFIQEFINKNEDK
jgi:hypothetical protein